MSNFYNIFIDLCISNNKSPSAVAREIGLSNAAATGWKNGKIPSHVTLAKIAKYFNVSVEWLKGETDIKKETAAPDSLTQEILDKLALLTPQNREIALAQLDFLISRQEKQDT